MSFARVLLIAWFSLLAQLCFAAGADGAVGMVLDVQGSGQLKDKSAVSKLQLLSYLKPQMQVTLDAGAKASLTLYATRTVYQLTGPAIVEIGKDKINVIEGKPPVTKSMQEKLVVAAENTNVTPGAVRMRTLGIKIYAPIRNSVQPDTQPTFSWQAADDDKYDVVLTDANDKEVVSAKVTGTRWQLPASVKLDHGKTYNWKVAYADPSRAKFSASGQFSIADKALADSTLALKPMSDAMVEEWIMYAVTLHDRGMLTDTRAAWQVVCSRRPDLAKACQLATAEDLTQ